jgi:hypothetical protein
LADGDVRAAVVSLDLLGVDFVLDGAIREAAAGAGELPPDHVVVSCSHTHAGPAVARLRGMGSRNEEYISALPGLVGKAVSEAGERLAPATLSYGQARATAGINRREKTSDGRVVLGRNPGGLVDDHVRVLVAEKQGGDPLGVVFNHACHGTTLGQENRLISSEWMGAACEQLRASLGDDVATAFLQGCCGQINPDAQDPSFEEVDRLGGRVAEAVLAALPGAERVEGEGLAVRRETIELPLQDPPSPDVARGALASAEADRDRARQQAVHPYLVRAHEALVSHARMVLEMSERGARDERLAFVIQGLRIGDLGIVALSGEVFLEFAHQIEAGSPFRHTLVLGCGNGCTCYVPTPEAFREGGYEPEESFRWYGTLPLAPEAGEVMVAEARRIMRALCQT